MRKNITIYTPDEPDREVLADCYYELEVVAVVSGYQVKKYIRSDTAKDFKPKTVSVEGVSYIRYEGDGDEYVEFLKNAIVFRSISYYQVPVEKPSRREEERAAAEASDEAEETVVR